MELMQKIHFVSSRWVFILPVALIAIDFLTGFVNAWVKRKIESSKMRAGLGKKLGEVLILVIGELVTVGLGLPKEVMFFFSGYILLMEAISICENLEKLNVPIPFFVKHALEQSQEELEGKQ